MSLRIGTHALTGRVLLAPMAGVTDPPFRALCREFGAALTCGEMLSADQSLWHTDKSRRRMAGGNGADTLRAQVDQGAQLIDLNLGCPVKKVCDRWCGSALLADEPLVARILEALVHAVAVPVTIKIRTGPDPQRRNAVRVAQLAEGCGVAAIAIHGRTRAERFTGAAEYESIRAVKSAVRIPVIANGDISTPQQALAVLQASGADAVMIGRAALGAPWIFRDVNAFLESGKIVPQLLRTSMATLILRHLESLYAFYGEYTGVRMARKHLARYCEQHVDAGRLRQALLTAEDSAAQFATAQRAFGEWSAAAAA
jgi:tRNA-dihydrouridine synthase B